MSHPKKDRMIQSEFGKDIRREDLEGPIGSGRFARIVADALNREFGGTHGAIKRVVGLTQANERAVKNWFLAKNGPDGAHIVALMRHSNEVLETLLILAGRKDVLTAKTLLDARKTLEHMFRLLDELQQ
jgi:hypothetical protein